MRHSAYSFKMEQNQSPQEPTPEQRYVHLCAQIGERQFLIAKLSSEVAQIINEINQLEVPQVKEPAK